MKKYNVTGMSCAACSARVEKAVSKLEGVKSCSVNLLTNSMTVEGGDDESIISAVISAGYGASSADGEKKKNALKEEKGIGEIKTLIIRLSTSFFLLILLMYISMGHLMWGFPLPEAFAENPLAMALTELLLSASVMIINQKFFISGTRAILKRAPNMDTLVALGSGVSFAWSTFAVYQMCFADASHRVHLLHGLYFESAAMIVALITLGKLLEAIAKGKTTNAIKSLVALSPKEAHVIRDGVEITVPSSEVRIGDILAVRPGESFPADAVVVKGESNADESSLTGESIPVEKGVGASVYAATINLTGYLECRAVKVGEDTMMGEVVRLVEDAAATKAPIAKLADRVSGIFVPTVLLIAAVTTIIWLIVARGDIPTALEHGIAVLVISCPCALGLATPVAIMVGVGIGAKGGVLFKSAAAVEAAGKAKIVLLDKTGTITSGTPRVTDTIPFSGDEAELLKVSASLEAKSEHPLARAVVSYAIEKGITLYEAGNFEALVGYGVSADIDGEHIMGGSFKFISEKISLGAEAEEQYTRLSSEGKTPIFFTRGTELLGIIAVRDSLKEGSLEAISALRKMGLRVIMLTGDNERTARAVASLVGIDEVKAGVLPQDKAMTVTELSGEGGVIMVGDGINDAPALTAADVGIAIGGGTDIAIESADVVLMQDSLFGALGAVKLGRATLLNIKENLFWAFFYNAICIPVAAGIFSGLGFTLSPMLGAFAMSLSSFTVVMNALRLNTKRIFPKKRKTNIRSIPEINTPKEDDKMIKLNVSGMMCPHCEARVKQVLEAIDGVASAEVSHTEKYAKVSLTKDIAPDVLIKAVTDAGYGCTLA